MWAIVAESSAAPRSLHGWGRTAASVADVRAVRHTEDVQDAIAEAGKDRSSAQARGLIARGLISRGLIARGLGRSYGDAAQNAGGLVLDMTGLTRFHDIDIAAAEVTVDAGVSLDTLMRTLLPMGLWVPVLPGTRQVTVGGAIAADVHGKNHHVSGSFGNHVRALTLVTADGTAQDLTPDDDLFWATVGGMGLTGVVTTARIALSRVETAYFLVDTDRTANIDELMERLASGDEKYPYSVAWFDSIATGARLGRAVLTRGRSARRDELPAKLQGRPLDFDAPSLGRVPDVFPSGLVNRLSGRAFNELWFRKAPSHRVAEPQNITSFFHPLDIVADWNRVYGPHGFVQYQFVVPFGQEAVFRACAERIAASGHVSCLNVLKRFGAGNQGLLSFPTAGWTLAVDLPVRPGLEGLLATLDALVLGAGGRIYLAKDSRLSAGHLEQMYPRLERFRAIRCEVDPDGLFTSDLARRLDL